MFCFSDCCLLHIIALKYKFEKGFLVFCFQNYYGIDKPEIPVRKMQSKMKLDLLKAVQSTLFYTVRSAGLSSNIIPMYYGNV